MRVLLFCLTACLALFYTASYSYVPFVLYSTFLVATAYLHRQYTNGISTVELQEETQQLQLVLSLQKSMRWRVQGLATITYEHQITKDTQTIELPFSFRKKTARFTTPLPHMMCGLVRIVAVHVTFEDPLQWRKTSQTIETNDSAIILPKPYALSLTDLAAQQFALMGQDGGAHERLVPYTPGDKLQAIHWPLSAKMQQFIVQKPAFAVQQKQQFALYFNDVKNAAQYEAFMNTCYSLMLASSVDEVDVWLQGWQTVSVKEVDEANALCKTLLAKPLAELYAPSVPTANVVLRYTGGA